jgi:hypothetical protein
VEEKQIPPSLEVVGLPSSLAKDTRRNYKQVRSNYFFSFFLSSGGRLPSSCAKDTGTA